MPEHAHSECDSVQKGMRAGDDVPDGPRIANLPVHESQYTYRQLKSKSAIRLLLLEPGSGSDGLRGGFREVSLTDTGPYDALSYVWGGSVKEFEIRLDGQALLITESAHTLLRRVRHPELQRAVWIDSVCINQGDNEEKSVQVAAMGDIYSSATRAVCWLGEDEDGDGAGTFELMAKVAAADYTVLATDKLTPAFLEHNDLPPVKDSRWFAALRFFQRPWFRRQWVVQEMVLAADVTMMCGSAEVNWSELVTGVNYLTQYNMIVACTGTGDAADVMADDEDAVRTISRLKKPSEVGRSTMAFQTMLMWRILRSPLSRHAGNAEWAPSIAAARSVMLNRDRATRLIMVTALAPLQEGSFVHEVIAVLQRLIISNDTSVMRLMMAVMKHVGLDSEPTFSEMLHLRELVGEFMYSAVTDPRDRFFAFLSLSADKHNPALQPDYAEPPGKTFLRFARYFFLESPDSYQHGMPLIEAGIVRQPPELASILPSWVTEYTYFTEAKMLTDSGRGAEPYSASGKGSVRDFTSTGNDLELAVRAGRVDVVSRVVPQPAYPPESEGEWREFLAELDAMTVDRGPDERYPYAKPGETWEEVQWRTLIANKDRKKREPGEAVGEAFQEDRRKFEMFARDLVEWKAIGDLEGMSLSSPWGDRWSMLAGICDVCSTEGGLVGLVPKGARVGDEVWIVLGETMPLLLRRKDIKEEDVDEKSFELVGACYCHGIMSGEALVAPSWCEERIILV